MPITRLVTLDYACGSHITAHCLEELRHTVDRESSSRARLLVIEPCVILLELEDGMEAALNRILERIESFTNEFVSYAAFLSHEEATEIKKMLFQEARTDELSGRSLRCYTSGEFFRITGKRDPVKKFLSTWDAFHRMEEVSIKRSCTDENASMDVSCTNTAVTVVRETSEEEWEYLKLVRFNEMKFATHPKVCIVFDKPGSVHFSGDVNEVRKVIEDAYRCLDSRQVQTYYKSEAVVECLKLRWCKDLLQRKWESAKIAATISVTEHNTAIIKCAGDLAIAIQILESTIKEARPIALPEDFLLSSIPLIWAAIESAALGKATPVLDDTHRQIIVAGNAEQLSDVVIQIHKLVNSGAPRDLHSRALTGSSSVIEDANRHSALENSGAVRSEMDPSIPPSKAAELVLKVNATAADLAEKAKVATESLNASERSPRDYNSGDRASEMEKEADERSQRKQNEYGQRTTSMVNSRTAEVNRDPENGRQTVGKELNVQRPNVPFSESFLDDEAEGNMSRNLHIQVIQGSVCRQTADILVNTVTQSLDLSKGAVSKAFYDDAKLGLQEELYKQRPAAESLLITGSHGLRCSKVFHVVCGHYLGQGSVSELSKIIRRCLDAAESMKGTSIIFPPIGAGGLGYPIESVVEAFQDAVEDFNRQRHCHLKSVTCAIFDNETYNKFDRKLQALTQQQISKRGSSLSYSDLESQRKSEKSQNTAGVPSGKSNYPLAITEGSSDAAQKLSSRGNDRRVSKQAGSSSYEYGEQHSQEGFSAYDTSKGQNSAVLTRKSALISDADVLKRIALNSVRMPSTYIPSWEAMGAETVKLLAIDKYSQEYSEVDLLFADCRRKLLLEAVQISRIQDKVQWLLYSEQHEKMKKVHGAAAELQTMLWFSCPQDDVRGLLQSGNLLNRSTAIRQDYGKGTYFYRDAIDAALEQLSRTSAQGTKCIILATVLTGRLVVGSSSMAALPQIPGTDKKYDSSVDNLNYPTIFVVYHDAQACPLYAIKFKARKP